MTLTELRRLAKSRGYTLKRRQMTGETVLDTWDARLLSGPMVVHKSKAVALRMLAVGLRALPRKP
jgi:hypothetical protein